MDAGATIEFPRRNERAEELMAADSHCAGAERSPDRRRGLRGMMPTLTRCHHPLATREIASRSTDLRVLARRAMPMSAFVARNRANDQRYGLGGITATLRVGITLSRRGKSHLVQAICVSSLERAIPMSAFVA